MDGSNNKAPANRIFFQQDGVAGSDYILGRITFLTRDATSMKERMRISSNGNVGIGTDAPSFL